MGRKRGIFRGRCRCGEVITFRQRPVGYKEICPACGAAVRLRPPPVRSSSGTFQAFSDSEIVVRCGECRHRYAATFRQMGRRLPCPKCGTDNMVSMPGRDSSGELRVDVDDEPEPTDPEIDTSKD